MSMYIAVFNMSRFEFFAREDRCVDIRPASNSLEDPISTLCIATTVWRNLLLFGDNFIANAEDFFLPFEIKKIVYW